MHRAFYFQIKNWTCQKCENESIKQSFQVLSLFPIETNNTVKQEQDIIEETLDETIADMADPAEETVLSELSQMDTSVSLAVMTDRTEVFHVDTQTESKLLVSM